MTKERQKQVAEGNGEERMENNVRDYSLMDKIKKIASIWQLVLGVGIPSVLFVAYKIMYQFSCQSYYRIPAQYFQPDGDYKASLIIAIILFSLIILALLGMKRKIANTLPGRLYAFTLSSLVGVILGAVNVLAVLDIVNDWLNISSAMEQWLDIYYTLIIVVGCICTVIGVLIFTFFEEITKFTQKLKKNVSQYCIAALALIFIIVALGPIIANFTIKLFCGVDSKRNYEIIQETEEVILSEYNGQYLVSKYKIIGENLTIHSQTYGLIPMEGKKITLMEFEKVTVEKVPFGEKQN